MRSEGLDVFLVLWLLLWAFLGAAALAGGARLAFGAAWDAVRYRSIDRLDPCPAPYVMVPGEGDTAVILF